MSKKVEFLYLSNEEVYSLRPTYRQIVEICESCTREKAEGRTQMPAKTRVTPRDEMYVHAKPGYIESIDVSGIKWQSNVEDNPGRGLPNNIGLIILTNSSDGSPRAVMDCSWITALRTPCAALTALKYLGPHKPRIATIIGLGVQGRSHFDALIETNAAPELEVIKVFDLQNNAMTSFVEYCNDKSAVKIEPYKDPESAIRESDILITCTQFKKSSDPIVQPAWVKKGSLALPADVGSYWTPESRDAMDKVITDDFAQTMSFAEHGFFQNKPLRLDAELGDVMLGKSEGRASDEDRIMCINAGLSLHDIALAQNIYERAVTEDAGRWLPW